MSQVNYSAVSTTMNQNGRITKPCERCGKLVTRAASQMGYFRFCSRACKYVGRVVTKYCAHCGTSMTRPISRGTKYCSRSCMHAEQQRKMACVECGKEFTQSKSVVGDRKHHFCSRECSKTYSKRNYNVSLVCAHCHTRFERATSRIKPGRTEHFCSNKCRQQFNSGSRNCNWKGGKTVGIRGTIFIYAPKKGVPCPYIAVHRKVAGDAVGRPLESHEAVLHIDNNIQNNDPDNLFICGSRSECAKRLQGSVPWPTESNLSTYERLSAANDADYAAQSVAEYY